MHKHAALFGFFWIFTASLSAQAMRPDTYSGLLKASDDFRDVTAYRSTNNAAIEKEPFQVGILVFGADSDQKNRRGGTYLVFGFTMKNSAGALEQEVTTLQDGETVVKKETVYRGILREAVVVADNRRQTIILTNPSYFEVTGAPVLQAWLDYKDAKAKDMAEYLTFLSKAKEVKVRLRSTVGTKDYVLTPGQQIALGQIGETFLNKFYKGR